MQTQSQKLWYLRNKERVLQKQKEKYYENRPKFLAKAKTLNSKYGAYKRGARYRNIDFKLTLEEFTSFWQRDCFYCDGKIETIGLDRIDNNIGYVLKNIVPCCATCNRCKSEESQYSFYRFCKQVVEHIENNPVKLFSRQPSPLCKVMV